MKLANLLQVLLALGLSVHSVAQELPESNFYEPPAYNGKERDIVTHYKAIGTDSLDDSAALKRAIKEVSELKNGTAIRIPAGKYYLKKINLKSDVTILIDKDAVLYPIDMDNSDYMFGFCVDGKPIENVAIVGDEEKFLIDLTEDENTFLNDDTLEKKKYHPFRVRGDTSNFMIANCVIQDNLTEFAGVSVGLHLSTHDSPRNGVIKNIDIFDAQLGYGTVQATSGENILYKNLYGEGGITLRFESGWATHNEIMPQSARPTLKNIYARNITCYRGQTPVMLAPATIKHGKVDIANVLSIDCAFGLRISPGSLRSYREPTNTPGIFSPDSTIRNVTVIYGKGAQMRSQERRHLPCELRTMIGAYDPFGRSYYAPSIAPVKYLKHSLRHDQAAYPINIINLHATGFLPGICDFLIDEVDDYEDCGDDTWVPKGNIDINNPNLRGTPMKYTADDLTLSPNEATLQIGSSTSLQASILPATEPQEVLWSSFPPKVLTIDDSGTVQAISAGTAIVTAMTPDGRYVDNTTITVTNPTAGSIVINPVDDTYVQGGQYAENNFGHFKNIRCKTELTNESWEREIYLKFDLSALPAEDILSAKLRLKILSNNGTGDTHTAYAVNDDSWLENAITWNTKPVVGAPLGSAVTTDVDSWLEIDVTPQIQSELSGNSTFSTALVSNGDRITSYHSRETTSIENAPQLIVKTANPEQTLTPGEDSFVQGGPNADANYGSQAQLISKTDPTNDMWTRQSYLKFDLSEADGCAIVSAKLRMKVESENGVGDLHTACAINSDNWDESTLTWNNKPSLDSAISSAHNPNSGNWIELNVTSQVTKEWHTDGLFSTALVSDGDNAVRYFSKEATAGKRPELSIVTSNTPRPSTALSWKDFVQANNLAGTPEADNDGDGQTDLYEYAFGGDPNDSLVIAAAPWLIDGDTQDISFKHLKVVHPAPGILYIPEWANSIDSNDWHNTWHETTSHYTADPNYNEITRKLHTRTNADTFFRLRLVPQ